MDSSHDYWGKVRDMPGLGEKTMDERIWRWRVIVWCLTVYIFSRKRMERSREVVEEDNYEKVLETVSTVKITLRRKRVRQR